MASWGMASAPVYTALFTILGGAVNRARKVEGETYVLTTHPTPHPHTNKKGPPGCWHPPILQEKL